ncbi:hypothetical protein, partial [Staphylococcus aureus]
MRNKEENVYFSDSINF